MTEFKSEDKKLLRGGGVVALEEEESEDELTTSNVSPPLAQEEEESEEEQMQSTITSMMIQEEESEDELLLTEKSNQKLARELDTNLSKPSKLPSYFTFHAKHPQARTHEVCLEDEQYSYVPNFVGGPLPRKDQGSREEYCMTMLTLFKPWRTGLDLRHNLQTTWDEASSSV